MRKVAVALLFCFLLLFAALWYIPSRHFRHVLPAPFPVKKSEHSPEETDRLTNDFGWLTKSRARQKMQKKSQEKKSLLAAQRRLRKNGKVLVMR